jgi:phosphoribosylamine-glycine ligase
MKQGVTREKVLLAGRWGKTHALVEAIVKRLCSFMDKSNAGIIDSTHNYRLGDLTYPEEILADAKGKNVDFVVIVPHITLTQGLTGRLLQEGIPKSFRMNLQC